MSIFREIFSYTLIASMIASTIRLSTPLILAALGGLYSERSGVINIALEGMMLAGAFTAAVVTFFTHSPLEGTLAAVAAGLLVAALHAVATISCRADQVVSGVAINILFLGAPALLSGALFASTGATPPLPNDQTLPDAQIFDPQTSKALASIFNQKLVVYLAFVLVAATAYVIYRTRFGLRLRAVGENPEAALAAGVSVNRMRYVAVLISGALTGLGGAYLSIGQNSLFTRNMTAGRGFIALAALILGKWKPIGALVACLFFGFAEAVAIRMQSIEPITLTPDQLIHVSRVERWIVWVYEGITRIPNQFIQMIPYVITIIVLAGWIGRAIPPKALGTPYVKE